jgi:hypothetical protein
MEVSDHFMPRPLCSYARNLQYQCDRKMGGPHILSEICEKKKKKFYLLLLVRMEYTVVQ